MKPEELLSLLESKKQRRNEKIRHLGLDHQPIIYEIMAAEKMEIQKELKAAKKEEEKDAVIYRAVIRSMCGWDGADEVTDEQINRFKALYSESVILEIYRCISDFNYLHEKAVVDAKKN